MRRPILRPDNLHMAPKFILFRVFMESLVNDDYFFVYRLRLVEEIFATTFELIVLKPFPFVLEGRAQTARVHKKSELGERVCCAPGRGECICLHICNYVCNCD